MLWEINLIQSLEHFRNPMLNYWMLFITNLGSTFFIIFISALVSVAFIFFKKYRYLLIFISAILGEEAITYLIKHLVKRIRPEILAHLTQASGFSFPSGHSFASATLYSLLAYFLTKEIKNKKIKMFIWILALLFISLIGFSRIYLGVHWITDVLGGFMMAFIWIELVIFIFKKKW